MLFRSIDARLTDKQRTRAQGKAESEPIEANTTVEGRSANRRVEVTLLIPAAERDREFAKSQPEAALNPAGNAAPAGQGQKQ